MKNGPVEDGEVNVFNLILNLRQEKLLVRSERCIIQELNELVRGKTRKVIRMAWITTKQRLLLYQRDTSTHNYQKVDFLLNSEFVDAKNALGFQNAMKLSNLLQFLRSKPAQLAKWLVSREQSPEEANTYSLFLETIVVGLYGCLIFSEDTKHMLTLLYELAKLQLLNCEDPRRIIKQRSCSFKQLFFLFHEVLQSAKFFLSATLEIPIVQMMSCADYYLDIDPDKTVMRFNSDENDVKNLFSSADEYRNEVITKLVYFANIFVDSLFENVYSFPKSLAWIVCQVAKIIEKSFSEKQAHIVTTELIFTQYVCPVIVDPEQFGICTWQVTEAARHNLIQVGQILQCLALSKYEPIDPRFSDIFGMLDTNRLANFVDLLFFDVDQEEPPIEASPVIIRDIMLFTEPELVNLVDILQKIQSSERQNDGFPKDVTIEEQLTALTLSRDNSPKSSRMSNQEENLTKLSNFFNLGSKNNVTRSTMGEAKQNRNAVLIFHIDEVVLEPIGLLPEEKIVELSAPLKNGELFETSSPKQATPNLPDTPTQNGDRKPFNYQDEGSIGNTSDNLEATSEAASNHSADSSIELENEDQNDNLSDMVSANVSGRGTPNISGRDTPSSQVCENDDRAIAEARQADSAQPQPNNLSRQIRSEIDDKFCKFEIKKLLEGDETISIISETWSTDVLASDNETIDAGDSRHERPTLHLVDQAIQEVPNIMDLSETHSESAWSTDVMASDNDDVVSVAQSDDAHSVTRSDDRSETDENACTNTRRLSTPSNFYNATVSHSAPVTNPFFAGLINANSIAVTKKYVNAQFQEYKDSRINGKIYHTEQTLNNTEQSLVLVGGEEIKTTVTRTSTVTATNGGTAKKPPQRGSDLAGPSGLPKRSTSLVESENDFLKQNHIKDRQNEILLSNCSLNSSSSGSSSHSLEVKALRNENPERWESKQWLNSSGSSLNVTLTPSESNSELSILSINNLAKPTKTIGKKSVTMTNNTCLKPSISTGAIPKSISFDMSADKGLDEERSKRGGFFGKLRMGFKNRRGKSFRNQDDFRTDLDDFGATKRWSESSVKVDNEVSEDILAKYRTKPYVDGAVIVKENCDSRKRSPKSRAVNISSGSEEQNSFNDIKNKLRLVLSNTSEIPLYIKSNPIRIKDKIETMLRLELGKARRLRELSNVTRISEAIRCVNLLNNSSCLKLVSSMKEDVASRSTYIKYLATSKQELLFCDNYLDGLQNQIAHDKNQCEKYLAVVCVKEFLSQQEAAILEFCEEFKQLNLADEKCDILHNFYAKLYCIMNGSPFWKDIFHNREKIIKITLERFIMSKTYKNSIYPNGDGDRDRDHVLYQHIEKLSKIIAPDHKDLDIPKTYLREAPWLPAQDALRAMNACRTPRDKVKCVVHCAKCIMELLCLSQSGSSTTADDFTPVLVYVIIKVNPEDLLSTIQYVNSFFVNQLSGEELYWWTQFTSSVEFIKTMDYSD